MTKSFKLKKDKPSKNSIDVSGDISNSVLISGSKNKVIIQFEQLKTAYGLFTIPQLVANFTGCEAQLAQLSNTLQGKSNECILDRDNRIFQMEEYYGLHS